MASLKLNTPSGGSVTLSPTDTASNFTVSLPSSSSTLLTSTTFSALLADEVGVTVQAYDANILTTSAIGSTVQAYDADLTSWAGKTAPSGTAVGTTDSQTLTNKTLTGYTETVYNLTGTEISPANGTIQYKTLSGDTTFTETISDGQCVTLMVNPATYTITWPTITWIGSTASTAPTLTASVYNCITLFQFGSTLYGKFEGRV